MEQIMVGGESRGWCGGSEDTTKFTFQKLVSFSQGSERVSRDFSPHGCFAFDSLPNQVPQLSEDSELEWPQPSCSLAPVGRHPRRSQTRSQAETIQRGEKGPMITLRTYTNKSQWSVLEKPVCSRQRPRTARPFKMTEVGLHQSANTYSQRPPCPSWDIQQPNYPAKAVAPKGNPQDTGASSAPRTPFCPLWCPAGLWYFEYGLGLDSHGGERDRTCMSIAASVLFCNFSVHFGPHLWSIFGTGSVFPQPATGPTALTGTQRKERDSS